MPAAADRCHKLYCLSCTCFVTSFGTSFVFHEHTPWCTLFPRNGEKSLNVALVRCGILHNWALLLSFCVGQLCCNHFAWPVIWLQNPAHFWNYCSRIHKCKGSRTAKATSLPSAHESGEWSVCLYDSSRQEYEDGKISAHEHCSKANCTLCHLLSPHCQDAIRTKQCQAVKIKQKTLAIIQPILKKKFYLLI